MSKKKTSTKKPAKIPKGVAEWLEDRRVQRDLAADLELLFEVARSLVIRAAQRSPVIHAAILGQVEKLAEDLK